MKFVIFLVTCVAAYVMDECGCRNNTYFAKVVDWCTKRVNLVVEIEDIRENNNKGDAGRIQHYKGKVDVVHTEPTNLSKGQWIDIQMIPNKCSDQLPLRGSFSTLLGGTFENNILTITTCQYRTWYPQPYKVHDLKGQKGKNLCQRYEQDVAERERQIARIFDLVENGSPICKDCPVVFNRDNLTDWCLADFEGKIDWIYEHRTQITRYVSVNVTKVFENSPTKLKVGDEIKAYISDFAGCRSKILGADEVAVKGIVHRADAPPRIMLDVIACANSEDDLEKEVKNLANACEKLGIHPKNTGSESTSKGGPGNFDWSYYELAEFCENDFVGEMAVVKNSEQDFSVETRKTFRISTSFANLASNPLTVRFSDLGCKDVMTKVLGRLFLVYGVIHPKENVLKVVDCAQLTPELEKRAKDWSAQCETEFKDLPVA